MKNLPVFLSSLTMEQKFSLSWEMLLKGMGTVFMALLILWVILTLFGKFFGGQQGKANENKAAKANEQQKPAQTASAPVAAPVSDDGALIAAITAAIEAYRAEEGTSSLPFRVVSFKRKKGADGWNGNSSEY